MADTKHQPYPEIPARVVTDEELGPHQRLALLAYVRGFSRVSDVEILSSVHDFDTSDRSLDDYADYILLMMRTWSTHVVTGVQSEATEENGRRLLGQHEFLLKSPDRSTLFGPDMKYTHPCPLCDLPVSHQDRYPLAVCRDCASKVADADGRAVTGMNNSMSGGFTAFYTDAPDEVAASVTQTHRAYVEGLEVSIDEAKFGGVVVQALAPISAPSTATGKDAS